MDLKYSKKQLNPIITKYGIDVENNKVFQAVILLFNEQTYYQVWALKLVFEHISSLAEIQNIKQWAIDNQTSIHFLSKGNIVAYKTANDIKTLLNEMKAIDEYNATLHIINKFNTAQRNDIKQLLNLTEDADALHVCSTSIFKKWSNILTKFAKLPNNRQMGVINTSSAIHNDTDFLYTHIADSLAKAYKWEKEDMLAYMANNCPDCFVVYNEGDIVIIRIKSFESSKKMCGNGRTQWCLTREKNYYDRYVSESQGKFQYFLFNFGLREDDDFAHIGFTVSQQDGIINAHSTRNNNLMGKVKYKDDQSYTVHEILSNLHIPQKAYMKLLDLVKYEWSIESLLAKAVKPYVEDKDYNILWIENNQIVIKVNNQNLFSNLLNHTFLRNKYSNLSSFSTLIFFDFNIEKDENMSLILIRCTKDKWGQITPTEFFDAYGNKLDKNILATTKNIEIEDIIGKVKLQSNVLLHKFIEDNNEAAAIKLLEENADNIDVNYQFGAIYPIFATIDAHMPKLFKQIFNHPNFNSKVQHFFDVNVLEYLVLMYKFDVMEEKTRNMHETEFIEAMIREVLESDTYDFNMINTTYDSILNVCCERSDCNWIVKELLKKESVNPNIVNDIDLTALGQCLKCRNFGAIEYLLMRPDIVIRDSDYTLAQEMGYDLKQAVKKAKDAQNIQNTVEEINANQSDIETSYKEIFKKILSV